jgi:hypothetical protein
MPICRHADSPLVCNAHYRGWRFPALPSSAAVFAVAELPHGKVFARPHRSCFSHGCKPEVPGIWPLCRLVRPRRFNVAWI